MKLSFELPPVFALLSTIFCGLSRNARKLGVPAIGLFLMGCTLMFAAQAQPVALQVAVANNDKLQKEYGPYKLAIGMVFGEDFRKQHEPYSERRKICKWEEKWEECSYLKMSNASTITEVQKKVLEGILLNPCKHIAAPVAPTGPSDAQASRTDMQNFNAYKKRNRLVELCKSDIFAATEIRIAGKSFHKNGEIEPDTSKGEIGFEARISRAAKSEVNGVRK